MIEIARIDHGCPDCTLSVVCNVDNSLFIDAQFYRLADVLIQQEWISSTGFIGPTVYTNLHETKFLTRNDVHICIFF